MRLELSQLLVRVIDTIRMRQMRGAT